MPDTNVPTYPELPPEPKRSWLAENRQSVILGGIALLLGLSLGLTTLIQRSSSGRQPTAANANRPSVTTNSGLGTSVTNRPTFRRYEAVVTPDADGDGLTDSEEQQLGTDPKKADTDADGLSDYDEAKIYRTNPLKPDSDGDGQTDGQEVAAGTNPNGSGQLRDLSQSIQQLSNTNQ